MKPLAGKRTLVTGSSAGLWQSIARRLVEDGAEVSVLGRDFDRLARFHSVVSVHGGPIHKVTRTLSSDKGTQGVFNDAVAAMGGIDILGKNPGGEASDEGFRSWLEVTPKEWRSTYNSNVVSMIRFIRLAVPAMREAGWGGILNNRPPSLCR